ERPGAHPGGDRRRRQRVHHEALRQRHHPDQVRAGGAAVTGAATAPFPGAAARPTGRSGSPYRIMIVDDSAVIRGLLTRSLEADPDLSVVASVGDGQMAISALQRHDVEIVILDLEMPVMDGFTALPKLIAAKPGLRVLVASGLTRRGADVSLQALAAGASDYVTKPGSS